MEVLRYLTESGVDIVEYWLESLTDERAASKIVMRMDRLEKGNFGDCKPLREGVWELRIDWGPGYRVYYGMIGLACVILLCGGDKRKQASDIERAIAYFKDYKRRVVSS